MVVGMRVLGYEGTKVVVAVGMRVLVVWVCVWGEIIRNVGRENERVG